MSLDRPLALLLLLVPLVLLWLRTRAARPRAAEASSLLVWQKVSPSDTVPEKPRPPLAAWIEAAGAALLVLGMAGPRGPAGEGAAVTLLRDVSPSMVGRRLDAALVLYAPDGPAVTEEVSTEDPETDLPGVLAGRGAVVVLTDHRLPSFPDAPPRLQVVGAGERGFNAGITRASGVILPDGRWRILLVVEAHGSPGPVAGTLRMGNIEETFTVGPGKEVELIRDVPAGVAWARVMFPGDCMQDDDSVTLRSDGGGTVTLLAPDREDLRPLARALAAAGARRDTSPGPAEAIGLRGERDRYLTVAFAGEAEVLDARPIEGRNVVASDHALTRDVRIDPSVNLGRRLSPEPGKPIGTSNPGEVLSGHPESTRLLTENGQSLATFHPAERNDPAMVLFRFVPGGTWVERDPSFVVLARNLVEFVGGGDPRVEASGLLNPRETREAAEGETFGDLRAAIEEARRPDPATRASYAFALLLLGAAGLAVAWLAMR